MNDVATCLPTVSRAPSTKTQPLAMIFCMHFRMTIKIEAYVSDFETVENWVRNAWKVIQTPFQKLDFL